MVHDKIPDNFTPDIEVVGCSVEWNDKILLLQRSKVESYPGAWGLPAGKTEPGEDLSEAMIRELAEETSIVAPTRNLVHDISIPVTQGGRNLYFHMFKLSLDNEPEIAINSREHSQFQWYTIEEVLSMQDRIEDLGKCLRLQYQL